MKNASFLNFGIIISFLLPGFLLLIGLSISNSDINNWLITAAAETNNSVGRFLYTLLASLAIGLLISSIRWFIIDNIFGFFGIKPGDMNFGKLNDSNCYTAFIGVVENHYNYYQYYSNSFVAIIISLVYVLLSEPNKLNWIHYLLIVFAAICLIVGAGDALNKFYKRAGQILS